MSIPVDITGSVDFQDIIASIGLTGLFTNIPVKETLVRHGPHGQQHFLQFT